MAEKITIRIAGLNDDLKQADKSAEELNRELTKTSKTSSGLSASFGGFASMAASAGVAIGAAMAAGGAALVKFGSELETTRVQFKTLLGGNAGAANQLVKDLNSFADATAFTNNEVLSAGRSLLAFGFASDKIEKNLQSVGDIAAGTGTNFGELAEIFGKAKVQGRLFGEDINQLTGRGIPVVGELAKNLGVAESQIKKMVSEGKIGFPELQQAFETMTGEGGKFHGMMEELSKTTGGLWSTMTGKAQSFAAQLGEPLLKPIRDVMEIGIEWMNGFLNDGEKMEALIIGLQNSITWLANSFARAWDIIKMSAEPFIDIGKEIWSLLTEIGALFGGAGGLGNTFAEFWAAQRGFTTTFLESLKGVVTGIRSLLAFGSGDIAKGKQLWSQAGETFAGAFDKGVAKRQEILTGLSAPDKFTREGIFGKLKEDEASAGLGAVVPASPTTTTAATSGTMSTASGNVTGTSQKNINITIGNVVDEFTVATTNIKEGAAEVKETMAQALLEILNEANRVAAT